MASGSATRVLRAQQAGEADVELALDQPVEALHLGGGESETTDQLGARRFGERLARLHQPAKRRGPVDAVEAADLIDVQAVERVVTQEIALPTGQRPQARAHR